MFLFLIISLVENASERLLPDKRLHGGIWDDDLGVSIDCWLGYWICCLASGYDPDGARAGQQTFFPGMYI